VLDRGAGVEGFDALRRAVLEDPVLQLRLRPHRDWAEFCVTCRSIADELGLAVGDGELELVRSTIGRPGQVGFVPRGQWNPGPDPRRPPGFTPVQFDARSATVDWLDMRGLELERPFYEEVVQDAVAQPYRLLFRARTAVNQLDAPDPCHHDTIELAGLIFHTSRCGSTLVCRMLAQVPGTVVISEPAIVDQLLRAPGVPDEIRGRWVAAAVLALTQSIPGARRAVLKLDAWATRYLDMLRATFPDAPAMFLHRDPAEVVASQLRVPGMTCARGLLAPELFDLDLERSLAMPSEEYCAIVIRTILTDALEKFDDAGLLLGYEELPGAVVTRILPHFGIDADVDARKAMREIAEIDAKQPYQRFDPAARATPTAAVREACRRHAGEPYARLRARQRPHAQAGSASW
jgi:hypothetical protein